MKKLLLTFAVLLGFALPGLAANLVFDFSSNKPSWMPSGSNSSQVTKTAPNGIDVTFAKNSYYNTAGYLMIKTNSSVTISPNINFKEINVTTSNSIGSTAKMSIKLGNTLYGSDKAIGTKNTTFTFTNESVTNANTEVSFNATTGNSQIVKIEFVEAEPTGPVDFEPAFKDQAYTIYKDENLDINSLITVNTPPSVTYALPEGTTAIEQTANGVFVGKEATAAPVTVTASWEAVADKWNAGSATFTIGVQLQPVEFGSPYTDMETPCQTKNLETSETPVPAADFWGNMGSIEVMYSYAAGNLALNTASTDKITMTRENNDGTTDVVGEISATDETILVMNPEDGGDGMFYMHFAALTSDDEMDPTPVLPDGLYTMTIPAGFMLIDGAPNLEYKAQWRVGEAPVIITETLKRADFTSTKTGYNYASYTSEKTGIEYYAYIYLTRKESFQIKADAGLSGIVTKSNKNGYILQKVDIEWDNETANGRQLNMYVSDKAYTAPSDLFSGVTPAGTLTYTKNEDNASFGALSGENAGKNYVGFRANANAQYITSITLYWIAPPAPTAPEFTLDPTEEGAEYTDISNYGHSVTIAREEGVTYTYRLNEEEIEKELAENLILTPGAESGIGFGTINTMVIVAKKGDQTVESEKAYFLTHPYASVSEGKIKLTSVAPAEHNVKIYYTIIDSAEPQAIRATRAAGTEYAAPVKLTTGQKIQYWAEAAHPVNEGETLKSAVVTNSLKDDGTLVGVDSIEADENAPVEFYTIDGMRVAEPENGLYIVRQGNKVYKVIIRK